MGMFSSKPKDPAAQEIKELKKEQRNHQGRTFADIKTGQIKPGTAEWRAAEDRNKALAKQINKLERGR
jgi:hypothetical protein